MSRRRISNGTRKGFTLLEVLVALVLISVIASLSLPLFTSSVIGTVAQDRRLDAIEQLNTELQSQLDAILTNYQGEDFTDAPSAIASHFASIADISVSTEWVAFVGGGGAFSETSSATETDHLRVDINHAEGTRLSFIVSKKN